jgi:hypothetical protein
MARCQWLTCNPSYSGGRDQEDCDSKPAWGNSSARPYLKKNPSQKRAGGVAQGVGSEVTPQYWAEGRGGGRLQFRTTLALLTLEPDLVMYQST